ncbi:MAG: Holliday junction branch migration protein RuvA [Bacteroidaceae bacterium]|nr:Holliday junction branch migration protein RuvA [Bacteroidaceae bacterium]
MIEYIVGRIDSLEPTQVVLETAGGVGYGLNISLNTYSRINETENPDRVKLYAVEIIREDCYTLYGFYDKVEREVFLLLLSVSGIGGNTARTILSAFSPAELQSIISNGNDAQLKRVKGLGAKTAGRIIVDLKDKVATIGLDMTGAGVQQEQQATGATVDSLVADGAVQALAVLGYPQNQSKKVVDKICAANPDITVEQVIKQALKLL